VVFLPGAWLTFGLRLGGFSFWERLITGAVLAPCIVGVEFFLLRFLGVPFEAAVYWLVGINTGAVYVIWRRAHGLVGRSHWREVAGYIVFIGFFIVAIAPQILDAEGRPYIGGHA